MEKKREFSELLMRTVELEKKIGSSDEKSENMEYTTQQMTTALRIIACFKDDYLQQSGNNYCGCRVFSPFEENKFSFAFRREVRRLSELNFMKNEEIEKLLSEAAVMKKEHLGLQELQELLEKVITDKERLMMMNIIDESIGSSFVLN